jgi:hypothetical protein
MARASVAATIIARNRKVVKDDKDIAYLPQNVVAKKRATSVNFSFF